MSEHMPTLYSISIPPITGTLANLKGILMKAKAAVEERRGKEQDLLNDRVIFDQFPLVRQVQIASDAAKSLAGRLAGIESPKFEDTETTIDALIQRIDKTLELIATVPREKIDGREDQLVAMPYQEGKALAGLDYARFYGMPNFYFHVIAAYEIVRKNGIVIGKDDYIGNLPLVEVAAQA
jgi:hypothetical protein